jgi:hypothetical protein
LQSQYLVNEKLDAANKRFIEAELFEIPAVLINNATYYVRKLNNI